ncbi:MAG TPA: RDD family protein [Pilimelia sp.]|nr:RDD family protein [Pilimelia sp.]
MTSPPAGPPGNPQPGYPPYGYPAPVPPGYRVVAPPARAPGGQPLASFGDRLAAYLIDAAILTGLLLLLILPLFGILFVTVLRGSMDLDADGTLADDPAVLPIIGPMLAVYAGAFLGSIGLSYIYHVEMMFRTGQTVGKRALRLQVVPLHPGRQLDRPLAVKRFLAQVLGSFIPFFAYVDGLWQLWDKPYQQCLHDKAADTVVVKLA